MVVGGRRTSIAVFIALGAGLISFIVLLYVGWVLLGWRDGILLFFGILLVLAVIAGVVLNTTFLVREVRRNAQHDAFINAVTHELKTPVASIRLYLETLQTRAVDEPKRQEFYRTMLDDSDRLLGTIEQILRTGRTGQTKRALNISAIDFGDIVEECLARARRLYHVPVDALSYSPGPPVTGAESVSVEGSERAGRGDMVPGPYRLGQCGGAGLGGRRSRERRSGSTAGGRRWTAQQLRDATPFGFGPELIIRDNDGKFGAGFDRAAKAAGVRVLRTAVQAPLMNSICERFLGSVGASASITSSSSASGTSSTCSTVAASTISTSHGRTRGSDSACRPSHRSRHRPILCS